MLIGEILKQYFNVKEEDIHKALEIQRELGGRIGEILIQIGSITESQLIKALSIQLNIPMYNTDEGINYEEIIEKLDFKIIKFLIENLFIPIKLTDTKISLVTNDPFKLYVIDYISKNLEKNHEVFLATERDIKELAKGFLYFDKKEVDFVVEKDIEKLKDMAFEAPVVKYLNDLIARAVELNASDIHFEPEQNRFNVRLRIDGVLHNFEELKEDFYLAVVSRIKLLSGLDIAERRLPQDGKFSTRIGSTFIDIRVSTIPTVCGEDVVLRLLYRGKLGFNLSELGIESDHYEILKNMFIKPYGMLLVTGPTGSGKTTTLYSILSAIKSPEKKIITIEDPVEYQIKGLTQIQVKPDIGLTFASALRSILRHDPDIIMVGEIRDTETAQIAVQSALTGHLVLSTLHTNDTVSSLFRLIEMGVEDYLLNASVLGIVAQRIVRLNCKNCLEEISLSRELIKHYNIDEVYEKYSDLIKEKKILKGRGCKICAGTGYRGRIAIFEVLNYEEDLKELFIKTRSITSLIEYLKQKRYFRTLREDGIIKVLKGLTTLDEVLRVS